MVLRGGKKAAGEPPPAGGPAWVPRPALLAAACGLPPGEPPCPEAKLFLEQGHHRGEFAQLSRTSCSCSENEVVE